MSTKKYRTVRNLKDFFETHGVKGFFTLYLQRTLLRLIRSGIRSRSSNRKTDTEYNFFFGADGNLRRPSELEESDRHLEAYCLAKAKQIVAKLEEEDFYDDLSENAEEIMSNLEKLNWKLQQCLQSTLGVRWGESG